MPHLWKILGGKNCEILTCEQVLDYCDDGIQKYFPIIKLPIIEVLFTDRETLFMS